MQQSTETWRKGQTMICKTLHRKLKIEQHEPHCLYQYKKVSYHVFVCYVMYLCVTSCICVLRHVFVR